MPSPHPIPTGLLQTVSFPCNDEVIIHDQIYGPFRITDPLLVELLHTPELRRLTGVCQHGITGLFGLTPRVTRFEHSVGALLLVRKVGASLEDQVAALLHDISHTALSHVVDWALSKPDEPSYHEAHKLWYIETMTALPQLLTKYGFGPAEDSSFKPLHEDLYPLVERPAPHLCADRLDYALRDAVAFGKLALPDAQRVFASLRAFPDVESANRMLVLSDVSLALALSRAYLECDRDVWCNPAHVDMYRRTGTVIGDLVRGGKVHVESLWTLPDDDFWELLRRAADPARKEEIAQLERHEPAQGAEMRLPPLAKIRTLDPDICVRGSAQPVPLSVVYPPWATERQEYIAGRERLRL